jgi:hypothetical protein
VDAKIEACRLQAGLEGVIVEGADVGIGDHEELLGLGADALEARPGGAEAAALYLDVVGTAAKVNAEGFHGSLLSRSKTAGTVSVW